MKKLALVLALVVLLLVATLPARLIAAWVDLPPGVSQVQGYWWSGQAWWQQPEQAPLPIRWQWQFGRQWRWQADDGVSRLEGLYRPGAIQRLNEVSGQLSLERVDLAAWLPGVRANGWLALDLATLAWSGEELAGLSGQLIWEEAALTGLVETSLGRIALSFESDGSPLAAGIRSLEPAPIAVSGELSIDRDRYRLDVRLAPDPARPDLIRQLEYLAEPDGAGQFHLRLSGRTLTMNPGENP